MKDITKDLADRLALLHVRHAVVFGYYGVPPTLNYEEVAETLEAGLRAGDADSVAKLRGVVDPGDLSRSEFWATPLGRLLFLAGGYSGETCTQTTAAGVLSCSRQWVSLMLVEGKLTAGPKRAVYAGEVRAMLKARIDRLVK